MGTENIGDCGGAVFDGLLAGCVQRGGERRGDDGWIPDAQPAVDLHRADDLGGVETAVDRRGGRARARVCLCIHHTRQRAYLRLSADLGTAVCDRSALRFGLADAGWFERDQK